MSICKEQQSLNTGAEPQVTVWDNSECTGKAMILKFDDALSTANVSVLARDSISQKPTTIGYADLSTFNIPGSQIVGIWVPLHFEVTVYNATNFAGESMDIPAGAARNNLSSPNYGIGRGEIRSITITRLMDWKDAQLSCCLGSSSDMESITSNNCKTYWGPGQAVASIYSDTAALSDCDNIMTNYCKLDENKWTPVCSCVNSSIKDIAACYDAACTNSAAYQTTNQKTLLNGGCPDKIVCEQYIKIGDGAKYNVLNDIKMTQVCPSLVQENGEKAPIVFGLDGSPKTLNINASDDSDDDMNKWLFLLLLVIIVVGLIISATRKKPKKKIEYYQPVYY